MALVSSPVGLVGMKLAIRLRDGEQGHASELLAVMVGIEVHHLGYATQFRREIPISHNA